MRKISKPTENPQTVFETCISRVRNPDLKNRLVSISSYLGSLGMGYDSLAVQGLLYSLLPHTDVAGISKEEMVKTYNGRMAQEGSPGREIYNRIKSSAKHGICPLCGLRTVGQVDHYLPESEYPAYAVLPYNLVPVCSDCNKSKTALHSTNPSEQTLHPYYDDVVDDQWLWATVICDTSTSVTFFVSPPVHWNQVIKDKVYYHFDKLHLNALFISQAGSRMSSMKARLKRLFEQAGASAVEYHLREEFDSSNEVHKNSWETAMYQALANSAWFCNGGFNQIEE